MDERKDLSGLPVSSTKHLNKKNNKWKAPNGVHKIKCDYCRSIMTWDKEVGYYFCNNCVYAKHGGK